MNTQITDTGLYTRCIMFIDAVFELQDHVKAQTDPQFPAMQDYVKGQTDLKFPIIKEIPMDKTYYLARTPTRLEIRKHGQIYSASLKTVQVELGPKCVGRLLERYIELITEGEK